MKRSHIILASIVAVFVSAGIAFGVYIYLKPTPQEVVDRTKQQLTEWETFGFDVTVESDFGSGAFDMIGIPADEIERTRFTGQIKFEENDSFSGDMSNAWFVSGSDDPFATLDMRYIDDVSYFRLQNFDTEGLDDSTQKLVGVFEGVWVKEELQSRFRQMIFEAQAKQGETASENETTDIDDMRAAFLGNRLITPGEMERTTLNGENVYRLDIQLNPDGVERFFEALAEDDESIEDMQGSIDDFENVRGEIWVERDAYQLRRMRVRASIPKDESDLEVSMGEPLYSGETTVDARFSQINEPVDIQAPSDARSAVEMFQEAVGAALQDMTERQGLQDEPGEIERPETVMITDGEFYGVKLPPIEKTITMEPQKSDGTTVMRFVIPEGDKQVTQDYFEEALREAGWADIRTPFYKAVDAYVVTGDQGDLRLEVTAMDNRDGEGVLVELRHGPPPPTLN